MERNERIGFLVVFSILLFCGALLGWQIYMSGPVSAAEELQNETAAKKLTEKAVESSLLAAEEKVDLAVRGSASFGTTLERLDLGEQIEVSFTGDRVTLRQTVATVYPSQKGSCSESFSTGEVTVGDPSSLTIDTDVALIAETVSTRSDCDDVSPSTGTDSVVDEDDVQIVQPVPEFDAPSPLVDKTIP